MTTTAHDQLEGLGTYKFGWADSDVAGASARRGLSDEVVRDISARKDEPEWMLEMRLKGLKYFGRKPLPASLPRKREVHDVPAEQLPCPDCGTLRTKIGEEIREQLEYVPASMIVIQHVRPKYACQCCEGNIIIAERLPEPIEKGLPGPGLLAQVAVSKYADHLPLYRQEGIFRRHGVELSRQTMCDWMAVCADLLEPIWKLMHRLILLSKVIQTDDTPVTVLDPVLGQFQGRLWDYLGDRQHPYTVYHFTEDRSGCGPQQMLKGYEGYLQADAYSGYDEVGCWMHARRKFYEARTTDPPRAHQALAWISLLYKVEEEAREKNLDDAQRHALRQEKSRPLLTKLKEWLDQEEQQRVLPKSPIGEAIGYARNHWGALERYLEAGFLEIDNGASERAMKPVALGRKNWLFAGSDEGGKTAATLMSLCTTCKDLGIDPLLGEVIPETAPCHRTRGQEHQANDRSSQTNCSDRHCQ